MKVFFLENKTKVSRNFVMDSLKQAIQEKMPEFQNDAVFSLAYEREDQFFLKSSDAILWGKVYFEAPLQEDLEIFRDELKKLSGIFRRSIIPYVFTGGGSSVSLREFVQIAEDCFIYGFVQAEGRQQALMLWKVSEGQETGISADPEMKNRVIAQGKEKPAKPFQLTREELSELIDLSLELRCLN